MSQKMQAAQWKTTTEQRRNKTSFLRDDVLVLRLASVHRTSLSSIRKMLTPLRRRMSCTTHKGPIDVEQQKQSESCGKGSQEVQGCP